MPTYIDQLQRIINVVLEPKKIISIVPSQTELLFDLGLDKEVIGITKFCTHPDTWFKNKTRVGGTKNVDIKKVALLKPNLIIANKEENTKEDIEKLEKIAPVWISDIANLQDALIMIGNIGQITNKQLEADNIINKIKSEFEFLENNIKTYCNNKILCCYLIWQNPYMSIGANTFINSMLEMCGLQNIFLTLSRYPIISLAEIINANPSVIILSSEPYPFKEKHIKELQQHMPQSKIVLADGEMFSWYGSRLQYSSQYFIKLLSEINT